MSKSKNYQKFLSATIAVATVASTNVIPYSVLNVEAKAPNFTDIKQGTYYYDAVIDLVGKGVIQGFEDGTFKPFQATTRGQASAMIARALELDDKKVTDPGFSDVSKNDRFYHSIAALVDAEIVDGVTKDSFQPNRLVTRAEMAKMITNAFGLKQNKDNSSLFTDVPNNSWYAGFVKALHDNGVTIGKTETTFAPSENVHRGQLATFIYRAQQNKSRTQVIEKVTDSSVTINGETYTVAQSLKELFNSKNSAALTGAKVKFESKDGVINKIVSLTLNSKGSASSNVVLDGGNAVIDGSVAVNGDYYEVKNLTINGDLTITGKVKNSFISEKLTVKGNTSIEEDKTSVASFRVAAENPKTKITIIFKDSTMATIEISKEDVYFSATGSTKVKTISLHANANITADPDVIIPKVDIKKGVTLVELNVTIKEIIIESNDEIKVTGKGNIDNVVINTDKKVTLDTRGQIKNLESKNENSNVTVGENARITNITVPEGKKAEEVVRNFDQVKDQIEQVGGTKNPDYTPLEPANSPSTPSTGGDNSGGQTTQPTADQSAANSVTNKITSLPEIGSLSLTNETAVNEAKEAFEGLTPAQKALVITGNQTKLTEAVAKIAQLKADQVAAAAVTAKIVALPAADDITLDDETEAVDVKTAFDNLTPSQKALVITENKTKLSEAVAKIAQLKADQVAAEAVTAKITALPAVDDIALDHETEVTDVKASFETLTKEQKALVSTENQVKLTDAFAKIALLKAGNGDVEVATAVTVKIVALPDLESLKLMNETAVIEVKEAFDGLSEIQKDLVDIINQSKLTESVKKIAQLKVDQEASAVVIEKIEALPQVAQITLENEEVVTQVKGAFDGLTSAQQLLVSADKQSKLTDAVAKIVQLKKDQEVAAKVAVVTEKITALPAASEITLTHETAVNDAQAAFNALTADQKALVVAENQTKLANAVAKINELHDQTNNPTNPGQETGDFFDAGLLTTERFGYVKLNIKNQGAHKVKYLMMNRDKVHEFKQPTIGEVVPKEAIEYNNEEFIMWRNYEVFVYQVDDQNKVVDFVDVNELWHGLGLGFEVDNGAKTLTIKSLVNPEGKSVQQMFKNVYLFNIDSATKLDDFSGVVWKETDGIPTMKLTYKTDFDSKKLNEVLVELDRYSQSGPLDYIELNENEHTPENRESLDVFIAKYAAENMGDKLSWYLPRVAFEEVKENDGQGNTWNSRKSIVEQDSVSMKRYREEILKQKDSLNSYASFKKLVEEVNSELKARVGIYKQAREAVDGLYKEDRYDYEGVEQLKEGLAQTNIDQAKLAVEKIDAAFKEKEWLTHDIEEAQYLLVKDDVDAAFSEYKREVTLLEGISIGDSISDLLSGGEKVDFLRIDIEGLGSELETSQEYQSILGDVQYLGIDELGHLVLNQKNTSGTAKTEYVRSAFYVGNKYIGDKIVSVTIPTSNDIEGTSAETKVKIKPGSSFIKRIEDNPAHATISLSGNVLVNDLINGIESGDGETQNVSSEKFGGYVKNLTDQLVEGDKFIVTAENGLSIRIYKIEFPIIISEVIKGNVGTSTVKVEHTTAEELKMNFVFIGFSANDGRAEEESFKVEQAKDTRWNK